MRAGVNRIFQSGICRKHQVIGRNLPSLRICNPSEETAGEYLFFSMIHSHTHFFWVTYMEVLETISRFLIVLDDSHLVRAILVHSVKKMGLRRLYLQLRNYQLMDTAWLYPEEITRTQLLHTVKTIIADYQGHFLLAYRILQFHVLIIRLIRILALVPPSPRILLSTPRYLHQMVRMVTLVWRQTLAPMRRIQICHHSLL